MGERIKNIISYFKGLPYKILSSPLSFVKAFGYVMVFSCVYYLVLSLQSVYLSYQADMSIKNMMRLEVFIPIVIGAAMVSMIEKMGKLWVDKNKNNIPDAFEPEEFEKEE